MISESLRKSVGVNDGEDLPAFAWPGGYPILYLCEDGGTLCPGCANGNSGSLTNDPDVDNDPQWHVVAYWVHYEGAPEQCDHCNGLTESAYGEVEDSE